jgi:hypothetical protein
MLLELFKPMAMATIPSSSLSAKMAVVLCGLRD